MPLRIRNVHQEYEAKLEPTATSPYPAARGKAEWKVYGDGTRQAKVQVSRLDMPDGTVLELLVENRRIALLTIQGGMARYKREAERGEGVPPVELDQVLQVIHHGQVILAGRFYAE
jgi:hypothetical protein